MLLLTSSCQYLSWLPDSKQGSGDGTGCQTGTYLPLKDDVERFYTYCFPNTFQVKLCIIQIVFQ